MGAIDPISHALIGSAVMALAPNGTPTAALWGALIGSELPDIDFVVRYWAGEVGYLKIHRGVTHGLPVLPLQAAAVAGLLWLIWPDAAFGTVMLWAFLGALSHVLFDVGNDYGTQALWPFSRHRMALDIIPIVDVWLLALFAAGWLVNGLWAGHRQAVFAGVWLLVGAYVLLRLRLRIQAAALVLKRFDLSGALGEAAPAGRDWSDQRLTIHPALLSLTAWRYVLQMPGEFLVGRVWVNRKRVSYPRQARNAYDRIVKASLKSQVVSAFADWARRPRVSVEQKENLYMVRWADIRYETDDFSPFTAFAWLDEHLTLVDEGLGPQRPPVSNRAALRRRLRMEMGKEDV